MSDEQVMPRAPAPWTRVVEKVLDLDVQGTYVRLLAELKVDDSTWSFGHILKAANVADRNAYDATRLARAAKLAEENLRGDIDRQLGIMREKARQELEVERSEGKRSKAPTKEEVADRVKSRWPDRHRKLTHELGRMHGTTRAMEGLERSWRSRCATLQAMLKARGR